MERILRSVIQVGNAPDAEEALANWHKLVEHRLGYTNEEDTRISQYLETFYGQMSAPPDFNIIREYFEKKDDIEVCSRLDDIRKAQFYIRTNFLSIVRSELEQQQVKSFILACRDAASIAEHGRNIDKPIDGKKVLRGVQDAMGFMFDKMSGFSHFESGEKLEGLVEDDADEFLDEYDLVTKQDSYSGRNIFGLEPVDAAGDGHKSGEFWVHCAYPGELKCVPGHSTIFDHKAGKRRRIDEIYESGDLPVVTALEKEGKESNRLVFAQASHLVQNGIRDVFTITLASGRKVSATDNHAFFTLNGWKRLDEITESDYIAVPRKFSLMNPSVNYSDAEIKVVGYLLGDGYVGDKASPCLTASNPEIRKDFIYCLEQMGMKDATGNRLPYGEIGFRECLPKNRAPGVAISNSKGIDPNRPISPVVALCRDLGMIGEVAATKRIPDEFLNLNEHQTCLLLGALWSTDGSYHRGDHIRKDRKTASARNDIKYYSTSEGLCRDVQSLLLRIGVHSTVTSNKIIYKGSPYPVFVTRIVGRGSKSIFTNRVNTVGKQESSSRINDDLPKRHGAYNDGDQWPLDILPDSSITVMPNGKKRYAVSMKVGKKTVNEGVLRHFIKSCPSISRHLEGDIYWDKVVSISDAGRQMTYDLSVPEHHSFVVDDVVSHNTSIALNYAYNNAYIFGKNIFYGIFEMPYKQLRRQLYVIHSSHGKFVTDWYRKDLKVGRPNPYVGLDYRKVRDGKLDELDFERLKIIAQDFKANCKGKLFVWRPAMQVGCEEVRKKSEMFHNKYGCDGIILDNIGNMKPKHRTNDFVTMINSVVTECRFLALNFARGNTVPVLGLFHMNRQGKLRADKADGRYDSAAISYANQLEKDADVITYTYLNDQLRQQGQFYLGCLKNRDNPVFERMIGKIFWSTRRMRAIESGMLDMTQDRILAASQQISLTTEDMIV